MCGRFTLTVNPDVLQDMFGLSEPAPEELGPRYNIAPTQAVAVIPNTEPRHLTFMRWGLIPSWAKDPKIGNSLINARGETVAEKPSFRAALKRRRCLIVADGFYEWKQGEGKTKTPYYIQLAGGQPFAIAGLWEVWHATDGGEIPTCTIITTTPNDLMQPLHDRMPVILSPGDYSRWLTPGEVVAPEVLDLLKPYTTSPMTARPVSTRVNSPRLDEPGLLSHG